MSAGSREGRTIKRRRIPMISLRVKVSIKCLPRVEGSNSFFKTAYWALVESFCYSLSFASSASVFVFYA